MNRTEIEARLAQLRQEKRNHETAALIFDGAIQDCEWFLSNFETKEGGAEQAPSQPSEA